MLHHGDAPAYTLHHGDALTVLQTLPSESVHVCITSPPYYSLRDYGTATWDGGDAECDHVDPQGAVNAPSRKSTLTTNNGKGPQPGDKYQSDRTAQYRDVCGKCGARRVDQQIGLEDTPEQYVSRLVDVFREVRRVLHKTGVLFLNLGDSYAGSGGAGGDYSSGGLKQGQPPYKSKFRLGNDMGGIKAKDLIGIPWMVAFALRADGWYLRSEIIWHKKAPMPESVTDRPTKAHEQVFLLAKSQTYFYDSIAIAEPAQEGTDLGILRTRQQNLDRNDYNRRQQAIEMGIDSRNGNPSGTRNKRSVWTLGPEPYAEAHFATMPTRLVEPCILAGSSAHGCCSKCGAPWQRVTEVERPVPAAIRPKDPRTHLGHSSKSTINQSNWHDDRTPSRTITTLGWQPTCSCGADVIPCTVLDPFAGSGTTLAVALKHGRSAIGIDLNQSYIDLAHDRIGRTQPMLLDIT